MNLFKKTAVSVGLSFLCLCMIAPTTYAANLPISASSFVIIDAKDKAIIYSRNPHTKRAPASTAKLLSVMVILDHLDPDDVVKVAAAATRVQPSKIHIAAGEQFYVRDLIKAMLLCSANDAAYALAISTGGTVSGFSRMMNAKAKSLGALHSNFLSPAGLPSKGQYSTAYDIAKIMMAAERYSLIVKTMKMRYAVITSLNGRKFHLKNTNKMLWRSKDREVIGKTGYTRRAQNCFAGRIRVGGKKMFVGIMGTSKRANLWHNLKKIAAFPPSAIRKTASSPILVNRKLHSRNKVKSIQRALAKAGYFKGPINGNFGPMTLEATKKFQKAKGLKVDGIVGPKTWKKLKAYL